MNQVLRVVVVAFASVTTYFVTYWLPVLLLPVEAYGWVAPIVALVCAVATGRYVWRVVGSGVAAGVLPTMLLWAAVAGGVGFAAGFFGPMIFAPEANQGPLLGIFITGPLGFALGGAAGFVYSLRTRRAGS